MKKKLKSVSSPAACPSSQGHNPHSCYDVGHSHLPLRNLGCKVYLVEEEDRLWGWECAVAMALREILVIGVLRSFGRLQRHARLENWISHRASEDHTIGSAFVLRVYSLLVIVYLLPTDYLLTITYLLTATYFYLPLLATQAK